MSPENTTKYNSGIAKCPTGISGLDELTGGGLPFHRTTLVSGGPGCGKTVMAMEFLIKGIEDYGEPGVFMSFEEDEESLINNFQSMGYELRHFIDTGKLCIEHVYLSQSEITETGGFSLEPLFLRLENALSKTQALRLSIDTIETIFSVIENKKILRTEIKRLFNWLHEKKVTSIVTGERGPHALTRQNLEEYVSDCVILLDHRVENQLSKRRLRIIKYRGSAHITDECPFIISRGGIVVIPVTSLKLNHTALKERISSGIPDLDKMLTDKGYYRGTNILVSGTSGTGKSSIAAKFADATCARNEKCLYFAFEESPDQICRNMNSIGIHLRKYIDNNLLHIHAERTSTLGLEEHLLKIIQAVNDFTPDVVIIDPITNFITIGQKLEIKTMLTRLMDFLKTCQITGFFTSLTGPEGSLEQTNTDISSIMDTWLVLRDYQHKNEKKRLFYVLKSRGMDHSKMIQQMLISSEGLHLKKTDFTIDHSAISYT